MVSQKKAEEARETEKLVSKWSRQVEHGLNEFWKQSVDFWGNWVPSLKQTSLSEKISARLTVRET